MLIKLAATSHTFLSPNFEGKIYYTLTYLFQKSFLFVLQIDNLSPPQKIVAARISIYLHTFFLFLFTAEVKMKIKSRTYMITTTVYE